MLRNGYGGSPRMDDFTYHYRSGTNKLDHVSDAVTRFLRKNDTKTYEYS